MGRRIALRHALAIDASALTPPPAWKNSEVAIVNGATVFEKRAVLMPVSTR